MEISQHEDFARCALALAGVPSERWAPVVAASSAPDRANHVMVDVPSRFGSPSSLLHFQRRNGRGYGWRDDPSLGVLDEVGAAAMAIAHTTVACTSDSPQPLIVACATQAGAPLCDFLFPSAAEIGGWHADLPADDPRKPWALHYLHDVLMEHHGWGALLFGHGAHEREMAREWVIYRTGLRLSGQQGLFTACPAYVDAETECDGIATVRELIEANAAWSQRRFGDPRDMPECGPLDAIAVGCRAVASSVRALQLLGVA
jgi:hypothetical protein